MNANTNPGKQPASSVVVYSAYRALEALSWNAVGHRTEGTTVALSEVIDWVDMSFPGTHVGSLKGGVATSKPEPLGWQSGPERRGLWLQVPTPINEGPCAKDILNGSM